MKRKSLGELSKRHLRRVRAEICVDTPNTSYNAFGTPNTSHNAIVETVDETNFDRPCNTSHEDTENESYNTFGTQNTSHNAIVETVDETNFDRPCNTSHEDTENESCDSDEDFQRLPNFEIVTSSDSEGNPSQNASSPDILNVTEPIPPKKVELKYVLASWAVQNGIHHKPLSKLLKILQKHGHITLPSDGRTLLNTPRETDIRVLQPGEYWHNGLKNSLVKKLKNNNLNEINTIELAISIDGLPLAKSSTSCLWPILGSIVPVGEVFIIGVYHGNSKPLSANNFLQEFVEEVKDLNENGLNINNRTLKVIIKYIICDAPAKAFILNVKGHGGYSSCTKCTVEGETSNNRVCFNDLNAALRTDSDFFSQKDEDYHCGPCILNEVSNLGLVTNVPLEYMHLVCLGVTRKLIHLLIGGPLHVRQRSSKVSEISKKLNDIKEWIPKDFVRKPRSLTYVKQWKATEYRQFLLYTGMIVLKGVIPNNLYDNFMTLSVAIRILCTENSSVALLDYANHLLRIFVEVFGKLYGKHFVSHNVHGLIHIVHDVKNFGNLDKFSAFPFENFMQMLKKLVRKHEKPLQQISRRYSEFERYHPATSNLNKPQSMIMLGNHFDGPLTPYCGNPQSKQLTHPKSNFNTKSKGDNCCLVSDGSVVVIKNFATDINTNEIVIVGLKFESKGDIFRHPCKSSLLQIYKCSGLSTELNTWPASNISRKCIILPLANEEFAVMPLVHFE